MKKPEIRKMRSPVSVSYSRSGLLRTHPRLMFRVLTCKECQGRGSTDELYQAHDNPRTFYSVMGVPCSACRGAGRIRWVPVGHPTAGTFGRLPRRNT